MNPRPVVELPSTVRGAIPVNSTVAPAIGAPVPARTTTPSIEAGPEGGRWAAAGCNSRMRRIPNLVIGLAKVYRQKRRDPQALGWQGWEDFSAISRSCEATF